jgi:hypothetical protein
MGIRIVLTGPGSNSILPPSKKTLPDFLEVQFAVVIFYIQVIGIAEH